jgi:hypothetical protein
MSVRRRGLDRDVKGGESLDEQSLQQSELASKVMVQSRLGEADRIDNLLDPNGVVTVRREQEQRMVEQAGSGVCRSNHERLIYRSVNDVYTIRYIIIAHAPSVDEDAY